MGSSGRCSVGCVKHFSKSCCQGTGKLTESELALRSVARVGLAQDGVAIARNDTASVQGIPEVLSDSLITEVVANGLLHLSEPEQDLLVSQAMKRAG
jgi:hypothetical protein